MSKQNVERRIHAQEFRISAEGAAPQISGYALVFDTKSDDLGYWVEEIDPHALDSVMAANPDVRALFNHDPSLILGRTTAGTLSLQVDSRGLAYTIDPPDTQVARDLIVSMRRKDITQSSFGFICKRDQWTENPDGTVTRRILEFDALFDVSPVTFPAYGAASSGIRSLPASMPQELRGKLLKRDAGADPDLCGCDCDSCLGGDCEDCSAEDCSNPQCACVSKRAARSAATRQSMDMRLQLARLRVK